jgi:hypothetical protein
VGNLNYLFSYLLANEDDAYDQSLIIRDIASGEKFPLYNAISYEDNYYLLFRPTASRHFALEHELPNKGKGKDDIIVWDIPEVTVAANIPTILNDPAMIAEREIDVRIENFKGDGSTAIVTKGTELKPSWNDEGSNNPITVIPRGEIVTILGGRSGASGIMVKYKNFEGYVLNDYLKR